jgi:protein tyrosine/serine phosphatase
MGSAPNRNRALPFFKRSDDERYARRMARIARWDRPIMPGWDRFNAWMNMVLADHGIFRIVYLNRHKVTERFWRAAQPTPGQIAQAAKDGIKTIVNLRGGREYGSWPLEREACEANGLILAEFVLRSREAPDREAILSLADFFATLAYPVLVHCKSGADRAGFMSALYLLIAENRSADEALAQLSPWYGHFRFAKTGILDAFIEMYRDEGEKNGKSFLDWVRDDYDPERLKHSFKTGIVSDIVVDRILHRE